MCLCLADARHDYVSGMIMYEKFVPVNGVDIDLLKFAPLNGVIYITKLATLNGVTCEKRLP